MALTPLDIQHKEFTPKFKGYDKDEVDDFLDLLKKDYEQIIKEHKDSEKQLRFAEEKIEHFQNLQDALNKSIVVAQDAADRLKENARKEAEIILFEAEKSADRLLKEAADKATQINQETDSVRRESRNFRQKLQLLVESQLNLIQNEEWDVLLNTAPEKEIKTPTLDEVLMNRSRKVDDLIEGTGFNDTVHIVTENEELEEETEGGQVEAIDILVGNK
ncbi:DivIVA domain-containing protein [Jeotgalibaca ciconiae]|uniref:DivIVA domain-containing protein n=1 Tax=Jeotgalibaca ciconiae TaxID=2496265 RepID=A0A3Q9BLC7_9LACT|nr:DivIVA domain-containing protein [Jeotgalibaca ciconiae]AZP05100.1 DivIVA domain-containing protein [Jeotgalibaca ciconiae]HJB23213.1 DivIVA domain-containing protein [Candidatus Jeotgalibaca pullicola]